MPEFPKCPTTNQPYAVLGLLERVNHTVRQDIMSRDPELSTPEFDSYVEAELFMQEHWSVACSAARCGIDALASVITVARQTRVVADQPKPAVEPASL